MEASEESLYFFANRRGRPVRNIAPRSVPDGLTFGGFPRPVYRPHSGEILPDRKSHRDARLHKFEYAARAKFVHDQGRDAQLRRQFDVIHEALRIFIDGRNGAHVPPMIAEDSTEASRLPPSICPKIRVWVETINVCGENS